MDLRIEKSEESRISAPSTPPPCQNYPSLGGTRPLSHHRTSSLLASLLPALSRCGSTPSTGATVGPVGPSGPSGPLVISSKPDNHFTFAGKESITKRSPELSLVTTETNIGLCNHDDKQQAVSLPIKKAPDVSCTKIFIFAAVIISAFCVFIFLRRDYIKYVLLSLEHCSVWKSLFIFSLLFAAVSFPISWGYILLNVGVGYLYGVVSGIPLVMTCALFGIFTAHQVIRRCARDFVWERLANETLRAIVRVVESGSGMKVIALARLTPIPFGLQNALFALSEIPLHRYLLASMVGMFPSQGLHVYIGSTLRSMEEVVSANSSSSLAYVIFAIQLLVAIGLLVFVLGKARAEFDKALEEVKVINNQSQLSGSDGCHLLIKTPDKSLTEDVATLHRKPLLKSH